MNRRRRIVLSVGALMLAALIVRPPYFGIDRASGGTLHSNLGSHWAWDPPSSADAYAWLTGNDPAAADPRRLASFDVRLNVVRLALNLVFLVAVVGVAFALLRTRATKSGAASG